MHKKEPYKEPNNMPLNAPLYRSVAVPYECAENRTLTVVCETDEKSIKEELAPTPFEFVTNRFTVYISDFSNVRSPVYGACPFMDAGIIIPARFKDIVGAYYSYEYEDQDYSICAGRERWGYPKKYGKIHLEEKGEKISGTVERFGVKIIDVRCELIPKVKEVPIPTMYPHLLLQVIPRAEGPGIFLKRVIIRDTSPDFKTKTKKFGQASVSLGKVEAGGGGDPLNHLTPTKVLGAVYTIGHFFATEEHGWGKVLATL